MSVQKIALNAYQDSANITGTDRMAYNFILELQKIDKKNKYIVVCSRQKYIAGVVKNPNFTVIQPYFSTGISTVDQYFDFLWRYKIHFRLKLQGYATYLSFQNLRLPKFKVAKRMIAMNLDIIPIALSEYRGIGRRSYVKEEKEFTRVANLADHIVSISDFSKSELCDVLNIPAKKVSTIHLAADPMFSGISSPTSLKNTKGIDGDYIFTIGGTEPRKDVNTVVDAYLSLTNEMRSSIKLVIAGGEWHGRKLEALNKAEGIITLGFVSDEQLVSLYKNSKVFVFASHYEGFGFAILEAMSCGTPVITASGTSLDEVAGDAALKFTPGDVDGLQKRLQEVLIDEELRKKLIDLGKNRASAFSWDKSARMLHKILTEGVSPNP